MGDLNLPILQWPSGRIEDGMMDEKQQAQALKTLMEDYFLEQIIQEPTRRNNILDLVMVNNPSMIHSYNVTPTIRP